MKMDFKIRIAQQSDSAELRDLYKNTVLVVNRRDYSQDEVEDWASCGDDLSNIEEMIKTHYFIVAVNQLSQIVGFSSITPQGYLYSMFIHADFQGKGIATMLLEEIERYAITKGIIQITSEVSLTARPFFEKQKYVVKKEQKTVGKVPVLGDIPLIGTLFRSTTSEKKKNEMVIMITPKIITDTEDGTGNIETL